MSTKNHQQSISQVKIITRLNSKVTNKAGPSFTWSGPAPLNDLGHAGERHQQRKHDQQHHYPLSTENSVRLVRVVSLRRSEDLLGKDMNITRMTDKTTIIAITKRSPGRGWFLMKIIILITTTTIIIITTIITITKRSPGRGWFLTKIRGSLERDLDHLFQVGQGGGGHLVVKTKVIIISIPSKIIIVILEI